ncbi:hypothetical protein FA15DRAFT_664830 [Coprinopsis marcescibilis]|uniref:GST N-terminal domain-containing protein n=1 Tax=Coprinopsis marcescibilis TaxID=230819 RepID=A0A5C3L9U1_COPMA|nr:hypothetical protein FA15DRAFT_664830 [Coprinopsis marcescibilis]
MALPSVIIYRYDASPYAHKVDNALIVKKIPHQRVPVSSVLPRPELADLLGISYRRIPVAAIGNDVYCDTNLIVSALERKFPASQGFGTLFPSRKHGGSADTGLIKAFSKTFVDNSLFSPASLLVPWDKLPPAFVKDRSELTGAPLNLTALAKSRDRAVAQLSAHMALVEEQLSDDRVWLFDTETPGLADISVHFVLAWVQSLKTGGSLFDPYPLTQQWLRRLTAHLKENKQPFEVVDGEQAVNTILSEACEPDSVVGFDQVEAHRLKVKLNDIVNVAPEDTGRAHPTTGKLVALSNSEIVLEITVPKGTVRCHFPRLGYFIAAPKVAKL